MKNYQKDEQPSRILCKGLLLKQLKINQIYLGGDQLFCYFALGSKLDTSLSFPCVNKDFVSQW